MKKQRTQLKILLIISGLVVLYIIIFPISLTREVVLEPVWYKELTGGYETARPDAQQPVVPFRVGDFFGYVDLKGRLQHLGQVLFDVTQANDLFINYPRQTENLVVQNTRGEVISRLDTNGYPLLHPAGDKLFIITRDSMGIRQFDPSGEERWRAEFASLITSLSYSKDNVLIGLVNGKLKLFDDSGSIIYDVRLTSGQMPVIAGCALSADSMRLGGISGLHPQKLFYVQREKFNNPELFEIELDTDYRREVLVKFSKNGRFFFFEQDNGLGIFEGSSKSVSFFKPQNGLANESPASAGDPEAGGPARVTGLEELDKTGHLCLLLEKEEQTSLLLFQPMNLLFYRESIPYQKVYLKTMDNHIFIGVTGTDKDDTEQKDAAEQPVPSSRTYLLQCDFYLM